MLRELRAKRKRRRVRVTRCTLWEEYRDEAQAQGGKAYSYRQFCARLRAHQGSCGGSAQMHFDYEPGLCGMADFSGKTLTLRTGRGETDVEIFVAVLAHFNLIYAEAVCARPGCASAPTSRTSTAAQGGASPGPR